MIAAIDLLSECSAAGVELYLDNGRLRYRARVGVYTEALRQKVAAHKSELIALIQARIYEAAHSNPAESSGGLQYSAVQQRGVHQVSVASGHAGQRNVAGAPEAPQAGTPATPTSGRATDVSVPPGRSRDTDVPSTPVKHTRRRALASAPPPHIGPLTDATHALLYSVIKDGRVERGTFISKDIKSEPEALEFLRKRYPELRVQWARVIQHPVCARCQHFTGGLLCNADQSPDYAARVGGCWKYESAPVVDTSPMGEVKQ